MKKTNAKKRNFGIGYIFIAVLAAAIGLCFFVYGPKTLETLAVIIGIIVILAGSVLAVLTLSGKKRGLGFGLKIAVSVAILASGIATLILRKPVMEILINVFALFMIVDGSFKLNTAVLLHKSRSRAWYAITSISVTTIACGFLAITYVAHAYMLGIALMIDAAANLFSAFYVPSLIQKEPQCEKNQAQAKEEKTESSEEKEHP